MEDWRYENMRDDIKRIQEDLRDIRGRTHRVESWQDFFPLRAMIAITWLVAIGIWVAGIAEKVAST